MPTLRDRTIIITGASSGIGAATAMACAGAGMNVVLNARRADKLKLVSDQISALGRRCKIVPGDVTQRGIADQLLDTAERAFGQNYAVFANAGYGMDKPMHEMTDAELRAMFEVNFFAGMDLLRCAAARLIRSDQPGHLLMCSSCLSRFTLAGHGAYCATKAAQNHVCRAMRTELKPRGIQVSSVHPITTTTEFFEASAKHSHGGKPLSDKEHGVPHHAPGLFVQTPQRVADAIVRCLHRPCPEVWTSFIVRAVAGVMTISPGFADFIMDRAERTARR